MSTPAEEMVQLLMKLKSSVPGVQNVAFTSVEGRTLASTISDVSLRVQLASTSAASVAIAKKGTTELGLGGLDRILISGSSGSLLLTAIGAKALLTIVLGADADPVAVAREVKQISSKLLMLM